MPLTPVRATLRQALLVSAILSPCKLKAFHAATSSLLMASRLSRLRAPHRKGTMAFHHTPTSLAPRAVETATANGASKRRAGEPFERPQRRSPPLVGIEAALRSPWWLKF